MKTWVRKTLSVGVLAAGALLFAPGAAQAGVSQDASDNNGIFNATQFVMPVTVPVNIVGNSDAVLGHANAAGVGRNRVEGGRHADQNSYDNDGLFNGTQFYMPVNVPVNMVGNADSVLGHANAAGVGVNGHSHGRSAENAQITERRRPGQDSSDNDGILNGTQIYAPIDVPFNYCGNSQSLLFGEANAQAICTNRTHGSREHNRFAGQDSSDNDGILNGTQIYAPFTMPVNLSGNSDALLFGHANAAAVSHNESTRTHGHGGVDQDSSDNDGILNGTQIYAPINMPVNMCGNALGILGHANAAAACGNFDGDHGHRGHGGHGNGHGNGGNNGHDNDGNAGDNGADDYAGDNGHDDGQYLGDNGAQDNDDDNGAGNGNGNTSFGSDSDSDGGRMARSATEASPVDNLTRGLGGAGLGGLDLLNTLR